MDSVSCIVSKAREVDIKISAALCGSSKPEAITARLFFQSFIPPGKIVRRKSNLFASEYSLITLDSNDSSIEIWILVLLSGVNPGFSNSFVLDFIHLWYN